MADWNDLEWLGKQAVPIDCVFPLCRARRILHCQARLPQGNCQKLENCACFKGVPQHLTASSNLTGIWKGKKHQQGVQPYSTDSEPQIFRICDWGTHRCAFGAPKSWVSSWCILTWVFYLNLMLIIHPPLFISRKRNPNWVLDLLIQWVPFLTREWSLFHPGPPT